MTVDRWFEKGAALIFLLLLVGLVGFLTFIPLPSASEKAVLMIIGGLMALCTQSLPKLFGSGKEVELEKQVQELKIKHDALEQAYDKLVTLLVTRHVIDKDGIA